MFAYDRVGTDRHSVTNLGGGGHDRRGMNAS
jgi:hypothetical protein